MFQAVDTGSAVYTILYTALSAFTAWYKILYTALYNIFRCRVQSRYCCDSHPDQGCTKCVQPGKKYFDAITKKFWKQKHETGRIIVFGVVYCLLSYFRTGYGTFRVEDIDASLCTHGFYGFADLDNSTWSVKIWDPWLDQGPTDQGCDAAHCHHSNYKHFIDLRNTNNFIPMISIGNK